MYLIDTNIILELLLNQTRADEVDKFFRNIQLEKLNLTDFSLFSLGIILIKKRQSVIFTEIINDLLLNGGIQLLRLSLEDFKDIAKFADIFNLDFDDAYQYTTAEKYNLTIISFDSDFDRTVRGRKTPADLV
ncbi:PIN domain-containing protein [Thermodesulfovibrio sp. Kuro-1]|uniref:type II toxin-antitoxin system VapC family toxin n=1 Tax=Thermodesulfovibrio sp. Kuro-1 TaxID=2580394 RepID=UPI0011431A59|nr:PIN domain-containing protein [Thermodesulfovibrio sp. Kuro-1]